MTLTLRIRTIDVNPHNGNRRVIVTASPVYLGLTGVILTKKEYDLLQNVKERGLELTGSDPEDVLR